nr:unnamed protein product [Callosobruchus analis]
MQRIWLTQTGWDDKLPSDLVQHWLKFVSDMSSLIEISVPRWLFKNQPINSLELHGFSDPSMTVYGACVYLKVSYDDGLIDSHLLCLKSRVAPVKVITLPRLELCGAVLLARLIARVKSIYSFHFFKICLWTVSEIVLAWINSHSSRWNTFVANKVAEIQQLTRDFERRHVKSQYNPADIVSRSSSPLNIKSNTLWFHGPKELLIESGDIPVNGIGIHIAEEKLPELKKTSHISVIKNNFPWINFSKYSRLKHTVAYCLRFINNCKSPTKKVCGILTVDELAHSEELIIRLVQNDHFAREITQLKNSTIIDNKQLLTLNPFIDKNGVLRVTERLENSNLRFDKNFPIILPPKNHVVRLLIKQEHERLFHAGQQAVLTSLRLKFWIISGLKEVKAVLKNCVVYHRLKAITAEQFMGALPKDRVTMCRPFLRTGIDFAGPITIKESRLRKSIQYKSYIAVFVCMTTRAIHLELVTSLSTPAFMCTLKRSMARRGNPSIIYSDNATNFKGASNQLNELYVFFENKNNLDTIQAQLGESRIRWKFIPPSSPHWGGLWEAWVKSLKHHLRRSVGNMMLTYEEMSTALSQIDAILNSRPLTQLSSDP